MLSPPGCNVLCLKIIILASKRRLFWISRKPEWITDTSISVEACPGDAKCRPTGRSVLFHLLRDDPDTGDIYRPLRVWCAYRRDNNRRDSLVRTDLNDTTASVEDRGTFPCGRSRCNTCPHTNASPTINTPGGHITINSTYTCTSCNVVYVIKCRTCNKVYIREREEDAWEIDSESTYVQHDKATPIFL